MASRRPRPQRLLRSLAGNVRRLRERAGLTQEALAEAVDVDYTYIQRIERAAVNPSVTVCALIADALEVPFTSLFRSAELPQRTRGRPKRKASRRAP